MKQVIAQGVLTKAQIGEADIQALNYQGSEMTLSGVGVPSVINPIFLAKVCAGRCKSLGTVGNFVQLQIGNKILGP